MSRQPELFEMQEEKNKAGNHSAKVKELSPEQKEELELLVEEISADLEAGPHYASDLKKLGNRLVKKTDVSRKGLCKELAKALCDQDSFLDYYEQFCKKEKSVFDLMAEEPVLCREEIFEKCLISQVNQVGENVPMSFAFSCVFAPVFYIPASVQRCLQIQMSAIHPKEKKTVSVEDFKKSAGFFSEENGLEVYENLPQIINFLLDSGFFERDIHSAILKSTYNKLSKIVRLTEFSKDTEFKSQRISIGSGILEVSYPKKTLEQLKKVRTMLLLYFLCFSVEPFLRSAKGKEKLDALLYDPQKLLRELVKNFLTAKDFSFDTRYIYPHFHSGYIPYSASSFRQTNLERLVSSLKDLMNEGPLPFSDFVEMLFKKCPYYFFPLNLDCYMSYYYSTSFLSQYDNETTVTLADERIYKSFVLEQGSTNLFLLFASLGLFEIVWTEPVDFVLQERDKAEWLNALNQYRFGKIQAIKMTPLGAYVFGFTDELNIQGVKTFEPPHLDENALIIHVDSGDRATQVFLSSFCIPLSQSLYKTDENMLKKYCTDQNSVNYVFSTLSMRSKGALPKIWEDLKKRILESFVRINFETDWVVFSLSEQGEPLVRHIEKLCRDGVCLKMEGKRVAVKKENISQFRKKIESAGFKLQNL